MSTLHSFRSLYRHVSPLFFFLAAAFLPLFSSCQSAADETMPADGDDNLCTIYEKRPTICNVAKVYEEFFSNVPEEIFYEKTAEACKKLQNAIVSSHEDREPSEH